MERENYIVPYFMNEPIDLCAKPKLTNLKRWRTCFRDGYLLSQYWIHVESDTLLQNIQFVNVC